MSLTFANPDELALAARDAMASGREAELISHVTDAAARFGNSASAWQWAGLLQRAVQDHRKAMASFDRALSLEPGNGLIAMGLAQVRLEAGIDAREDFEKALRLSPTGDAMLGLMAARYAEGEGLKALNDLRGILDRNPHWLQGHRQWAQLAAMIGRAEEATETVDRALRSNQANVGLWQTKLDLLEQAERHSERVLVCDEAMTATGDQAAFALTWAAALSDAGDDGRASQAFARLGVPVSIDHAIRLARHFVRVDERQSLARLADEWMAGANSHSFWPYASIAWRWTDPERWRWLEGDDRFLLEVEIPTSSVTLPSLAHHLRSLHERSGRFLDQSVRGGTQTDGPLLSRLDREIVELRSALASAVREYVSQLPPIDRDHPMLAMNRGRDVRFAGSWSVRLSSAGFHTAHVHPQGWISSAFYVTVPDVTPPDGWLYLGEPPSDLRTDLGPIREIEPVPGKLVLFPSMMWHGTRPFRAGERMTVAFDVARPVS